jgi:RNA polymerase sigma factor (sigma-70 family)
MISMALSLPRMQAADLVGRAVTMDEAAFRHLYDRTARPLRAYLMRSCGDLALADDLLQEAYLRMLRSGFEGEDDDHRKNYLYRIATNLLRDHFRRKRPETDEVPERDESPGHDEAVHLRSDVGGAMACGSPMSRVHPTRRSPRPSGSAPRASVRCSSAPDNAWRNSFRRGACAPSWRCHDHQTLSP